MKNCQQVRPRHSVDRDVTVIGLETQLGWMPEAQWTTNHSPNVVAAAKASCQPASREPVRREQGELLARRGISIAGSSWPLISHSPGVAVQALCI